MTRLFSTLRVHLILLVLLAIVPALSLALYSGLEQRKLAAVAAQEEALRLARLTAGKQSTLIEGAHHLLVALSQLPAIRDGDPAVCDTFLLTLLPQKPLYANLGVIDPTGNLICSALPFDGPMDLSDRAYFQRAVETRDFAIGDYQIGRVTGIATINVAYPILVDQDNVQGVIYAALDLVWMNELAAESQLPANAVITAFDEKGTILVRYPDTGLWVGQTTLEAPITRHILSRQGEGTVETRGVDGVLRLYAFTPLTSSPGSSAYVNVGIPATEAYAEANQSLTRNLTLLGLTAIFVLAATRLLGEHFILRPVQVLLQATEKLSAGDLSARTMLTYPVGELSQLAHAFDEMAGSLQQQIAERQRAEDLVRRHAANLEALNHASCAFAETATDYRRLLDVVAQEFARQLSGAALLFLLSEDEQRLKPAAHCVPDADAIASRAAVPTAALLEADELLNNQILLDNRPLLLTRSPLPDEALAAQSRLILDRLGATSLLLLPICIHDQTVGLLYLWRAGTEHAIYSQDDLNLAKDLADQAALYILYARLFDRAQRRLKQLRALHAIDRAITDSLELPTVLEVILEQVTTQLAIDATCILLFDEQSQTLAYAAGRGFRSDDIRRRQLALGEGYAGRAALEHRMLHIPDLPEAQDFVRPYLVSTENFVAYYAVPLVAKGKAKGVLDIFHRAPLEAGPEWLAFLEALALQAAIAIDNATLFAETRRLLQQTQEQARRMQQIIDTMPEGILLLDADRRILLANTAGREYLSLLAGVSVGEILERLDDRPLAEIMAATAHNNSRIEITVPPSQRIFEVTLQSTDAGGRPSNWVLVLRDVSQERQRQQYLQTQERLATVGQLAAGIAHDFNNIMAVITLYSQTLQKNPDLPKREYYLSTINQQANHAAELIARILDFSRRSVMERRPTDLLSFVKEVIKLLKRTLPETILVHLETHAGEYLVNVDLTRMQQALMNLALNARDAMPDGGKLTFSLSHLALSPSQSLPLPEMPPGQWITLTIADTGYGIQPEVLAHIFDPFFTTKLPGQGTGLGLAQVYGIVKQHDGHIDVQSQPGQGATFTIYLPALIRKPPATGPISQVDTPLAKGSETVLLVEDGATTLGAIQETLQILGYRVLVARTGREALALFTQQAETIDLVLSDMVMPEMGGVELYHALQIRRPDVKQIIMTGYPLENDGKTLLEQGIVTWLQKPFTPDELASKIRTALDN